MHKELVSEADTSCDYSDIYRLFRCAILVQRCSVRKWRHPVCPYITYLLTYLMVLPPSSSNTYIRVLAELTNSVHVVATSESRTERTCRAWRILRHWAVNQADTWVLYRRQLQHLMISVMWLFDNTSLLIVLYCMLLVTSEAFFVMKNTINYSIYFESLFPSLKRVTKSSSRNIAQQNKEEDIEKKTDGLTVCTWRILSVNNKDNIMTIYYNIIRINRHYVLVIVKDHLSSMLSSAIIRQCNRGLRLVISNSLLPLIFNRIYRPTPLCTVHLVLQSTPTCWYILIHHIDYTRSMYMRLAACRLAHRSLYLFRD